MLLRGKLVRDRIPEIIRLKLQEELQEYLQSGKVVELADLIEVCFAAAALKGMSPTELVAVVRDKHGARGGFDDRVIWMGNADE